MLPTKLIDEDLAIAFADAPIEDRRQARSTLIAIRQLEADVAEAEQEARDVAARYAAYTKSIRERIDFLRARLFGFVAANGKAAFPGLGTAYTTKKKPTLIIVDKATVETEYGDTFAKSVFDETDFKQWALERFEKTGEIPEGCDVVREERALAIRKT